MPENLTALTTAEVEQFRKTLVDLQGISATIADLKTKGDGVAELRATLDKIKEASLRWADLDAMKTRLDTIETRASRIDYQGKDGKQIDPAQVARRKALYAYLRKGEAMMSELERKDLVIADDPDGGYLVHDELSTTIIEALSEMDKIRENATVITGNAARIPMPKRTGRPVGGWTAESATWTKDATMAFGQVNIDAHKMTVYNDASVEFFSDTFINAEAYLGKEFAYSFDVLEGAAFVGGTVQTRPPGFMVDATIQASRYRAQGETATLTNAVALLKLRTDLPEPYWAGAKYYMNRTTLGEILSINDGNDRPLFGTPDGRMPLVIGGIPIVVSTSMPDIAANAFPIAYGDLRRTYTIYDRQGIIMQRDPYTQNVSGLVRILAFKRTGAAVIDDTAIRVLKIATS